jgi:hypothetical protein
MKLSESTVGSIPKGKGHYYTNIHEPQKLGKYQLLPRHPVGLVEVKLRGRSFSSGCRSARRNVALEAAPVQSKGREVKGVIWVFNLKILLLRF